MTDNKRFIFAYETNDQNCIWWAVRDGYITLWKEEVVGLLNELHEENMELKERNNRQYKQLNQLYHLIEEENWETLTKLDNELKENEKQLQREWECYNGE